MSDMMNSVIMTNSVSLQGKGCENGEIDIALLCGLRTWPSYHSLNLDHQKASCKTVFRSAAKGNL